MTSISIEDEKKQKQTDIMNSIVEPFEVEDEEEGPLEWLFTGKATGRLIEFFLSAQEYDYSDADIARNAEVSIKIVERDLPKLEFLGIVKYTRTSGRSKMYQFNKESNIAKQFSKLTLDIAKLRIHDEMKKQGLE